MGRLGVAVAGLAMTAWLGACSSPAAPEPDRRTPPEGAPGLGDFSVADMLAEVPASAIRHDDTFTLLTGDVATASDLGGLERPDDAADAGEWLGRLNGATSPDGNPMPVYVPLTLPLSPRAPAASVEQDLGWSVVDVDRFVSWATQNLTTTVAAGDFDDETLAGLPAADGVSSAGKGADRHGDLESASPARPQGIPLRMAVDDGWLVSSPLTPVVRDWLGGPRRTLADVPVLADLAATLDDAGVVSAKMATPNTAAGSPPPFVVLQDMADAGETFPEFDAYAIGWTADGGQPGFVVAYHVTGDVDAAVDAVTARWEGQDFRGLDMADRVEVSAVEASGDLVIVSGAPAPGQGGDVLMMMSDGGDLPFLTGPMPGLD